MSHIDTTKTTATKAWVGSGIAINLAFLGSIATALTDNVITPVEWLTATIAALTIAGGVFGGVYATTNRLK